MSDALEPTRLIEPIWLEPYPDVLLEGLAEAAPGPDARYERKESIELAFMVALQALPPRQRAVLILRDVLGFRTAEAAAMLDTGELAVKGALQRARAALRARTGDQDRERAPRADSTRERRLVGRFADAVENGDVDDLVALLSDDARIGAFLRHREEVRGRPLRVVPTRANTQPAFGCYLPDTQTGIAHAHAIFVLTLEGDRVSAITWFGDVDVFPHFRLPRTLPLRPG